MPKIDSEKFYCNAIKKYGHNARGLNWSSQAHQSLRFDVIVSLLEDDDLSQATLVDVGCGFGDFYTYLKKNSFPLKKYIGIDSLLAMCDISKKNTHQEILHLDACKDILPSADYYICSGALNVLNSFETVQFIQNCYKASKKAFIFNVLYGEKQSDTYNYLTKAQIQTIAKNLSVQEMNFKTDYIQNDITVVFNRS